jgi:hypothetical protein
VCGRAAARVEKLGIPTVIIAREGFEGVAANGFAGVGFAPEASAVPFPIDMFVPASDMSPLERGLDTIVAGLTKWQPQARHKGIIEPPKVQVPGRDHLHAVENMNSLFLRNLWGDGLPILPATEERVGRLLSGTDLAPDTPLGKILPRGAIATVRSVAIAAAMAGARPEYMPVILAVVKAMLDPLFYHQGFNSTTNSAYPVIIVNGPIAKQIRVGSGYGCLGPDPQHPAGATIGRTIRLILLNMGGALPGKGTMSIYGGPARFTNVVFAEDEDGTAPGWDPLSVERGFRRDSNTVTVMPINSTVNVSGYIPLNEDEALVALNCFADYMHIPNSNYWFQNFRDTSAPCVFLMPRGTVKAFSDLGWTKKRVKEFLWENSKFTPNLWLKKSLDEKVAGGAILAEDIRWPMPICKTPDNIILAVAGGAQSGHGYYMAAYGPAVVSREIELPKNFDGLLADADRDLGCGSDFCTV